MKDEKPVTNDELLEAVSSYGESGNAQKERLVFLTPRLHVALVAHLRELARPVKHPEHACQKCGGNWFEGTTGGDLFCKACNTPHRQTGRF